MKLRAILILILCLSTAMPEEAHGFLFRMIQNMRENRVARQRRRMMPRRCRSRGCQPRNRFDDNLIDNRFVGRDQDFLADPNNVNQLVSSSDGGLPVVQTGGSGSGQLGSDGRVPTSALLALQTEGAHTIDWRNGTETTALGTYSVRQIPRGFRGTVRDRFTGQPVQAFVGQMVVESDGVYYTADPRTVAEYFKRYELRQRTENPLPLAIQQTLAAYAPVREELKRLWNGSGYGTAPGPGTNPGTSGHGIPGVAETPNGRPTASVAEPNRFVKWGAQFADDTLAKPTLSDLVKFIGSRDTKETPNWKAQAIKQTCVNGSDPKTATDMTLVLLQDPAGKGVFVTMKNGHVDLDVEALKKEWANSQVASTAFGQTKVGDLAKPKQTWSVNGRPTDMWVNRFDAGAEAKALGYQEAQIQIRLLKTDPADVITRYVFKTNSEKPGVQSDSDFEYYCKRAAPQVVPTSTPTGADTSKTTPGSSPATVGASQAIVDSKCAACHSFNMADKAVAKKVLARTSLPSSDPKFMPRKEDETAGTPLSANELSALRTWAESAP